MTTTDLLALLPYLAVAAGTVLVMLLIAFRRSHGATAAVTVISLTAGLALIPAALERAPRLVTPLLAVDAFGLLYAGLIFAGAIVVAALAYGYLRDEGQPEELYLLLLTGTLGGAVMVASSHLASFFLGLETLSVSLYAMIAYRRSAVRPIEAGLKYLLLAGASSAFLLFGMALLYASTGSLSLQGLADRLADAPAAWSSVGLAMVLVGVGFKLAAVPFHLWTPDVYEGAPAPVTAFIASISKGAMLGLLVRYTLALDLLANQAFAASLWLLSIASMLVGTFLALLQTNVKRLLAYSSIAQMGYMLLALLAAGEFAAEATTFYVLTYFVTILAGFGVVTALSGAEADADSIEDYRGLFWRRPALAALLAGSLFSLAGMPLTAGFIGKYYAVLAGVSAARWLGVGTLVVTSAIGAFYYLRVIVAMYSSPAAGRARAAVPALSVAAGLALAALAVLLLWLGVLPAPFIDLVRPAVATLAP